MEAAADLVATTAERFPDAVRLARVVSIASRIEPELLRQARLQLLAPSVDAGAEADLWFSSLVQSATPVALTLLPAVAELLRRELAQSPDALLRSWKLLDQVHRDAPAAIRLEERVTWETLSGSAGSLERVEHELMSAVSAINEENRLGLARWALRAVPKLPEAARQTKAATTLVLTAAARLNAWHLLEQQIESQTLASGFINELQIVLPADFPKVPVGLRLLEDVSAPAGSSERRLGYAIEFSAPPSASLKDVIEVPATAPLMIEVSWGDPATPETKNVSLYQGRTETVAVGSSSKVTIRTAAGDLYTLSEDKEQYVSSVVDSSVTADDRIPSPPSIGYVRRYLGSQDIIEKYTKELSPDVRRTLQIVGPAGSGKTTVAAELASRLINPYEQRVVWLSAAGRSDFSFNSLLDGIATQLSRTDIRTLDPKRKTREVKSLLANDIALVVVDDFEFIGIRERTRCFNFLKNFGCATVIVSRNGVGKPSVKDVITLGGMSEDEATEFLKRTISSDTHSWLVENVDRIAYLVTVIAVCKGNPLAIQLLLAQIDFVQDINRALNQMKIGKGDPLVRVFDRSFNLPELSEDARAVLLATALFVPSAPKTALEQLARFDGNLDRLNAAATQLTRLKLAFEVGNGDRLAVDGFIREALKHRLNREPRVDAFRKRFVGYFLVLAEHYAETKNYDVLESEFENLLDAMDMAQDSHLWDQLTRLCIALADFFDVRGYWDEALRRNAQAQKAARKSGLMNQLPVLHLAAGDIYLRRRQFVKAEIAFRSVLRSYKGMPTDTNVALATSRLGSIALQQENLTSAENFYSEALNISNWLEFQIGVADNTHNLAIVKQEQGDLKEARRLYQQSLKLSEGLNDSRSQAISFHQLGVIAMEEKKYTEAEQYFRRSLDIKNDLQDRSGMADTLHQLGLLLHAEGHVNEASGTLRDALGIFSQLGSPSAAEVQEDLNALPGQSVPVLPPASESRRRPSKAASKKGRSVRPGKSASSGGKKRRPVGSVAMRRARKSRRASAKSYR